MKFKEFLVERRMAPLYHWMDEKKAVSVFADDAFNRTWKHETAEGELDGISFSRNSNFTYGQKAVRLTFDQGALASRFKIMPLDAERAFHHSVDNPSWYKMKDRKMNSQHSTQYAEEFVIGKIKNLHKYITKIEVSKHISRNVHSVVADAKKYAEKWNIPISIAPEVEKRIEDDLQRWEEDE